jgi:hypothetical protein
MYVNKALTTIAALATARHRRRIRLRDTHTNIGMARRQVRRGIDLTKTADDWHFAQMPELALPGDRADPIED